MTPDGSVALGHETRMGADDPVGRGDEPKPTATAPMTGALSVKLTATSSERLRPWMVPVTVRWTVPLGMVAGRLTRSVALVASKPPGVLCVIVAVAPAGRPATEKTTGSKASGVREMVIGMGPAGLVEREGAAGQADAEVAQPADAMHVEERLVGLVGIGAGLPALRCPGRAGRRAPRPAWRTGASSDRARWRR